MSSMEDAATKCKQQNSLFATESAKISKSSLLIDDECKYASRHLKFNAVPIRGGRKTEGRGSRKRDKQGRFSEQRTAQVQSSRIERFGELKRAYLGQSVVDEHLFARKANCHATCI